jgi:predicted Zn-dependent peptidase
LVLAMCFALGCQPVSTTRQKPLALSLANGLRVVALQIPGSTNVSIFTYLPMGLAADGNGKAQWSHLVEHLVIRTTIPFGSTEANAETLPDHMRLDFYGSVGNWEQGLRHHARWIEGLPFSAADLAAEELRVAAECDNVATRGATHKFALAAWAQGYRFGRRDVGLKADMGKATLTAIQRYRDERLAVLSRTLVCVVGGVDADTVFRVATRRLGAIRSRATAAAPVKAPGGSRDLTWDLDARHLVLTWPVPGIASRDYPALAAVGQWLTARLFQDRGLKALAGMVLAGTDLTTPEGSFLYVSASLAPQASFDEVRRLLEQPAALRSGAQAAAEAAQSGKQLAGAVGMAPDMPGVLGGAPMGMPRAMAEANLGIQYGMLEYRYGARRAQSAQALAAVTAADVQRVVSQYLAPQREAACTIRPRSRTVSVAK